MAKIIIINGFSGSGKDTFVEYCAQLYERTFNFHTSDPAKQSLMELGWDGEKTPEARKLLADMVKFSYLYDIPIKYIEENVKRLDKAYGNDAVVFIHSREYENVLKLRKHFKAITLFIDREVVEVPDNESDRNADKNKEIYDFNITNNGSLTDLFRNARLFMTLLTRRV